LHFEAAWSALIGVVLPEAGDELASSCMSGSHSYFWRFTSLLAEAFGTDPLVHAQRARGVFPAQVGKDLAMASTLFRAMQAASKADSGPPSAAVVLAGNGHVAYGHGVPEMLSALRMQHDPIVLISTPAHGPVSDEEAIEAALRAATAQPVRRTGREAVRVIEASGARPAHRTASEHETASRLSRAASNITGVPVAIPAAAVRGAHDGWTEWRLPARYVAVYRSEPATRR
jgi:hypothetical protein